ncbi:MAG: hypothetical protein HOP32_08620 [Nitrospira sp.]|nr:hypothetical protein [Nitrospira sp.]
MKVINRALCAVASGLCVALSFTACGSGGSSSSTPPPAAASPFTITTVAGTGVAGFSGDTMAATAALLRSPSGVAVNAAGDLWIADVNNNRIRKVNAAGIITTVAGTGTVGFNADSIAATAAHLSNPVGVAVNAAGDLWIADQNNHRIRRVDAVTGIITTVVGTGAAGFSGDTGPADVAQLSSPRGVAVDAADNLWIADFGNHRIRRVDAATGTITTVAGTGVAGFNGDNIAADAAQLSSPAGVAVNAAGDLWIADQGNHRIRRVDAASGEITTVAGTGTACTVQPCGDNGQATLAQLRDPSGVAVNAAGDLWIADLSNDRIRRVDAATGTITTVAGTGVPGILGDNGPATGAQLFNPAGVAVNAAGDLWIADLSNNRIRKVEP